MSETARAILQVSQPIRYFLNAVTEGVASRLEPQEFILAYGLRVLRHSREDKGNWSIRRSVGDQEAVNPVRKRPLGDTQR